MAELLAQGRSQAEIARELGISKPTVCFHARILGVAPKEDFARRFIPRPRLLPLDEILVIGRVRNRHHIKGRLLSAGLKEARCEQCGLAEWRGEPLRPELHHANGDGLDNRIENLVLLCPNCHSQTDTWGGLNKGRRAA